jgi:hypothetical protein
MEDEGIAVACIEEGIDPAAQVVHKIVGYTTFGY